MVLNSPKGFGDLFQRSCFSFLSFTKLKHPKSPTFGIDALSLCICMAQCLASIQTFTAKCLNSYESSCASLLAVCTKPLKWNKTQRMTPSSSLKFIGKSISDLRGSTICFSYFPSIWVNHCFNFYHWPPVDCWPIFESQLWGSTCSANHICQIFHVYYWI